MTRLETLKAADAEVAYDAAVAAYDAAWVAYYAELKKQGGE
jgi:hypothetical protein